MTTEQDLELARYCRDNNKMNYIPIGLNQATGEIKCVDSYSDQEITITNDQLFEACSYVEFTEEWSCDAAIKNTGVNCFGTNLAFRFEAEPDAVAELCNVAVLIREFEGE